MNETRLQEIGARAQRDDETRAAYEAARESKDRRSEDTCLCNYDHARRIYYEHLEDDNRYMLALLQAENEQQGSGTRGDSE